MRFDDWDVLLFPHKSEIPIPEFKIDAYSVDDLEAPPIVNTIQPNGHYHPAPGSQNIFDPNTAAFPIQGTFTYAQLPLLSCFVPSQDEGMNFTVSVHSWRPGQHFSHAINPRSRDGIPCFQVRVTIDGHLVSGDVIKSDSAWPLKISKSFSIIPNIGRGLLKWPQFHEEQLSQTYWRAGDNCGRIKVIISKGIFNPDTGLLSSAQNIVAFAFQHAPMTILRAANIAWSSNGVSLKPDRLVRNSGSVNQSNATDASNHGVTYGPSYHNHVENANIAYRGIMSNNSAVILDDSSLSPDDEVEEMMNMLPTTIGLAQAQSLRSRPGNIVLVDNVASTDVLAANTDLKEAIPKTPRVSGMSIPSIAAGAQPFTPDQSNKSKLGSPLKGSQSVKSEQDDGTGATNSITATNSKGKTTKTTVKRPRVSKTVASPTKIVKSPPSKVTKGRKPSLKKGELTAATAAVPPVGMDSVPLANEGGIVDGAVAGLIGPSRGVEEKDN